MQPQASPDTVVEITPQNFQDVISGSRDKPVFLLFWLSQAPPDPQAQQMQQASGEARQALEREAAGGKFTLGLVDVAQDQTLAQHLQVQALPALRVIRDGQIADQLEGPQPAGAWAEAVNRHTMTPGEMVREQLQALLQAGDHGMALQLVRQAAEAEPGNLELRVELADLLLITGDEQGARELLASIAPDTANRDRPATRLELLEEAAALPPRAELEARVAADGDDLEARYGAAVRAAAEGAAEAGLAHAMAILQADRTFREDIGRTTMLRIFQMLGKGDPVATAWRRKMFAYMH